MRRSHTIVGIFAAALAGLILAGAAPANANSHPAAGYRIADIDTRTFATASTATRLVTMQPPITTVGYQHWALSDTTIGTTVTNLATGGCLTPALIWSGTVYPPIHQVPCERNAAEYWRVTPTPLGTVIFRNLGRDGCMGREPVSSTDPGRLFLYPCQNDDRNQHFRLV